MRCFASRLSVARSFKPRRCLICRAGGEVMAPPRSRNSSPASSNLTQVVSNRDRGNAELLRQAVDVRGAFAFHQIENLTPAMLRHRGFGGHRSFTLSALSFTYVCFHLSFNTRHRVQPSTLEKIIFKKSCLTLDKLSLSFKIASITLLAYETNYCCHCLPHRHRSHPHGRRSAQARRDHHGASNQG